MFFLTRRMQSLIAGLLFPSNRAEWYASNGYGIAHESDVILTEAPALSSAFDHFLSVHRQTGSEHYHNFYHLDLTQIFIPFLMANGEQHQFEMIAFSPHSDYFLDKNEKQIFPARDKHIIYFTGIGSQYQKSFSDISQNAKTTGATIYGFNYPGVKNHGGIIREAKDLVNSGIAVVNHLLHQGIAIDDIILQGDSYGAAVAYEVKRQCLLQLNVHIRVIMNNTFDSFEHAVKDAIEGQRFVPDFLSNKALALLRDTGWDLRPGDDYMVDDPYQCHLQHEGDLTLTQSRLALTVKENQQKLNVTAYLPESYIKDQQRIFSKSYAKLKPELKNAFGLKYGVNAHGEVDAHIASISELESETGGNIYSDFVNDFIGSSQRYIDNNPQSLTIGVKLDFLTEGLSLATENKVGFFSLASNKSTLFDAQHEEKTSSIECK